MLASLSSLRALSLSFGRAKLGPGHCSFLASMTGLRRLSLQCVTFLPGALPAVCAGLQGLTRLDLPCCRMSDEDLKAVVGLPALKLLDLMQCFAVTEEGVGDMVRGAAERRGQRGSGGLEGVRVRGTSVPRTALPARLVCFDFDECDWEESRFEAVGEGRA